MFPLIRLTILSLANQVNLTFILYTGSLVKCLQLSNIQLVCPEIKRIQDDQKIYFRSSDPYLLHLGGNTYTLKALFIYYLLLTISYDKLTLNMGNVQKCLFLYPVFENKFKKILQFFII